MISMSKIAILTLPFNNNYGGLLQSYALQRYLSDRGHEVMVIKNHLSNIEENHLKFRIKKFIKIIVGKEKRDNKRLKTISKNMNQFVTDNMNCTKPIYNEKALQLLEEYNFDTYIVGSDQVWRFDYTGSDFAKYFFSFLKSDTIKRISFAASFGIDNWTKNESETKVISSLLSKFDAISVREKSGVSLCQDYLDVTPNHLLDPVFLLDRKDFQELINKKEGQKDFSHENGLLVYMLDITADKRKVITLLSDTIKQKPFIVGVKQENKGKFNQEMVYPPVSDWIEGFVKAKYVLTDSFHGCAFAILFNKPFIVYGNSSRGMTRFESLLNSFNLESRFISNSKELSKELITKKICFDNIKEVICNYRKDVSVFFNSVNI